MSTKEIVQQGKTEKGAEVRGPGLSERDEKMDACCLEFHVLGGH